MTCAEILHTDSDATISGYTTNLTLPLWLSNARGTAAVVLVIIR